MAQVGIHGFVHLFFAPILLPTVQLNWSGSTLKKTNYVGKFLTMNSTSAYAVIDGVQARGEKGNYSTQRIKFDSNRSG